MARRHVQLLLTLVVVAGGVGRDAAASDDGSWPPGPESGFRADVYPSRREAVWALGAEVAGGLPADVKRITVFAQPASGDR